MNYNFKVKLKVIKTFLVVKKSLKSLLSKRNELLFALCEGMTNDVILILSFFCLQPRYLPKNTCPQQFFYWFDF